MEALVQHFVNNISAGNIWTAVLFLAIFYILKKEPLGTFFNYLDRKEKGNEFAKALLESKILSGDANEFLREHLEKTAFHRFYGIRADPEMRRALLKFYENHQHQLDWNDLRRAYPSIKLIDTTIIAKLGLFDHILGWVIIVICCLTGAYASFVMLYAMYAIMAVSTTNKSQFFGLIAAAFALLLATIFFSSMNWAYHSTRRIISASAKNNPSQPEV